jgi:hypothetical protein
VLRPFVTRARVTVRIGEPIELAEYSDRERDEGILEEITLRVMREIARLAGVTSFEPTIAGRRWKSAEDEQIVANGE